MIGPSNPLASIAPILAVPGIREALQAAAAPVVAVSPIVGGEVLKGPTASFMAFAALDCSADGVADFYGELLDGIVADEDVGRLATLQTDTRMDDARRAARAWPSRRCPSPPALAGVGRPRSARRDPRSAAALWRSRQACSASSARRSRVPRTPRGRWHAAAAPSGTSTSRNSHSGSQPSPTSHTSSRSAGSRA